MWFFVGLVSQDNHAIFKTWTPLNLWVGELCGNFVRNYKLQNLIKKVCSIDFVPLYLLDRELD